MLMFIIPRNTDDVRDITGDFILQQVVLDELSIGKVACCSTGRLLLNHLKWYKLGLYLITDVYSVLDSKEQNTHKHCK